MDGSHESNPLKRLYRDVILIRPPCEAHSLLIGVTEGCAWQQRAGGCKFCGIYTIQDYRVRPWEKIKQELDEEKAIHGPGVQHVFLAGGSAISAPTSLLIKVLDYIKGIFPHVTRIGTYGKNHDVLRKGVDELRQLAEHGLSVIYMGLESGSNNVLKYMNKGTTPRAMIRAARIIKNSGIKVSLYVILGLGGNLFPDHAQETANVLNEINPDYIRFRSLNFIPSSKLYHEWKQGVFKERQPIELLKEELYIIEHLNGNMTSFVLNDHVSNHVYIEGKLPGDKSKMIKKLKDAINDPFFQRLTHHNRTAM
ncbi:MAG: radical SAM protein [Promethearchaeota archaeon]